MIHNENMKHIAITGRFQSFKREIAILLIESLGCSYSSFISDKTTVLVTGYFTIDLFNETKQSKKQTIAKNKNLNCLSEMEFLNWLIFQYKHFTAEEKKSYCESYYETLKEEISVLENSTKMNMISDLVSFLERKVTIV